MMGDRDTINRMNTGGLFRFFPPPVYLTMRHSGVSLSDDGVRIIGFTPKGNQLRVAHCAFEPVAPGVITGGTVEKPEALIEALKKLQQKFSVEFVAGSIPDEKAYIFTTRIPRQGDIDLSDAVAFRIPDNVPISGADAMYTFSILAETPEYVDVVVRVVHQKAVSIYLDVFKQAGMEPLLFKIQSQAVADAVCAFTDMEPRIIVHIEPSKTTCMIVDRHEVQFSTVLDVGTNAFVSALEKAFSISHGEALMMVKGTMFIKRTQEDVFFALGNVLSVIRDQIIKLREYWKTKSEKEGEKDRPMQHLSVTGLPAAIDGFAQYLDQNIDLTVIPANVWSNAFSLDTHIPSITRSEALEYASAIGLALPNQLHF